MTFENQLSKNFTLKELTYSDTANSLKIDNIPTQKEYDCLKYLCVNLLQPIRDKINKPIKINSGYRGPKLNEAVKGVKTSQHCFGQAADIEVIGMSNYDFACFIKDNFQFDQLILEFADNLDKDINSGWVHVSLKEKDNRNEVLTINKKVGTVRGLIK